MLIALKSCQVLCVKQFMKSLSQPTQPPREQIHVGDLVKSELPQQQEVIPS